MKRTLPITLWVDSLSIISLPKICKITYQNKGACIRFLKASFLAYKIIQVIKLLNIIPIELEKITYSLGDMEIGNESIGMMLRVDLPEMALKISKKLKKRFIYREIIKFIPEERFDTYLQKEISNEIYPIVRLLFIIFWNESNNNQTAKNILYCLYTPLLPEIESVWPYEPISLGYYNDKFALFISAKKFIKNIVKSKLFLALFTTDTNNHQGFKSCISLSYTDTEEIDLNKRSALFWYPKSGIEPQRVYFYFKNKISRNSEKKLNYIEDMRMRCIFFRKIHLISIFKNMRKYFLDKNSWKVPKLDIKIDNAVDKWIKMCANTLFLEVELWFNIFKSSNIKILFTMDPGEQERFAQGIALELLGGVSIGAQRSTHSAKINPFLRYCANDISFVWGEEAKEHTRTGKTVKNLIISGYPYDKVFTIKSIKKNPQYKQLIGREKFVVSLFDSVYSKDIFYSKKMMNIFYSKFLEWLFEDEEIVIIIKEKKPKYFDRLSETNGLIEKAESTNRFIRLKDALGCFPAEASVGTDMAVGFGVSTAVIESVIVGGRGIHCDITKYSHHSYYRWGYEKIIFDNIDRLIAALKRYKDNPDNEPELGNWSSYIDRIDPFRDGQSGERVGAYIRWLLESFDKGKNRNEAIRYANKCFVDLWGEERVIDMRHNKVLHMVEHK